MRRNNLKLGRAVGIAIESLEGRQLLHGVLDLHVNFQPATSAVPVGYVVDSGQTYADRGNGWVYGWNASNTANTRERNANADQRYDTFVHMQVGGNKTWELAVADGQYQVHIVAGDPSYNDSIYKISAEGVLTVNGTPTSGNRFVEGTQIVNVTDGKLTISSATGSSNNKIAFVDIASVENDALPAVSVVATDPDASETGDPGTFTFTRTGSIASALEVQYQLGGIATNGVDYEQLSGSLTILAGASSASITVKPINDAVIESSESVYVTILPSDAYTVATSDPAIVKIADNNPNATFSAMVNFQPANVPVPAGYLVDSGLAYGARGNGLSYGWVGGDNSAWTRDRNASNSPDQRYDTFIHFNNKTWEMAVPNGIYNVRIVSGDAGYYDSIYKTRGEVQGNLPIVDGTPTSSNRWIEGNLPVWVSDGKLSITSEMGAFNNKICFIEITNQDITQSIVNVTAGALTTEQGSTQAPFMFTRTGDGTLPLTIHYTISGTATNGVDYQTIPASITIPAGQPSASFYLTPIDDAIAEGEETAIVTIVPDADYIVGNQKTATIRIADNDTPVGNTIAYSTKASYPVGRAEALRAVVDGKLYVFGGFASTGPVKDGYIYDPATDKWTALPDMPKALSHAGVAVDGHDIYVAGGYIGTNPGTFAQQFGTTDVWKYNIDAKTWTAFTSLPKAVAGGGLVLLGRQLHWVGGNNNQRQDIGDHYYINLDNVAAGWKTATSLAFGRSHLGVVALSGKIYAIGGQFGNDEGLTTQKYVQVWDPNNPGTWTQLKDLPTAISHIASATIVYGNRIITMGGETAHNVPTDLVYAYDPATDTWAAMTKLPGKRFSGVAAVLGSDIYFTTGSSMTTTWKAVVS